MRSQALFLFFIFGFVRIKVVVSSFNEPIFDEVMFLCHGLIGKLLIFYLGLRNECGEH